MLQAAEFPVKSPEAFRTISEVAFELDVPQHVLRFWESRFSQIRPVKRAGGRRYYRPEDVDLLRGIRGLLYSDGFTIKGVQKVLRDRGLRHVIEIGHNEAMLEGVPDVTAEPFMPPLLQSVPHVMETECETMDRVLAEEERASLELLLDELGRLKIRLHEARSK